jgi:hypothetical protein
MKCILRVNPGQRRDNGMFQASAIKAAKVLPTVWQEER